MSPTGFANLDGARAIATAAARMHSMDIFDFEATDFSADDANGLASTDTLPTSPFCPDGVDPFGASAGDDSEFLDQPQPCTRTTTE